jgi:hypothetical protein
VIRLVIFAGVVFVLPALVVATTTFVLLTAARRMGRPGKILLSVTVGVVFLIGVFVPNPQLGFLVAPGVVLIATIAFLLISTFIGGTAIRYRVSVALLVAVAIVGGIQVATIDGFQGALCSTILADHTTYAPSYSASGFNRAKVGMSLQEVEGLVGKPLEEWTVPGNQGQLYWRWTKSRDGSHYYRYRVATFRDGHLEEETAFFFCALD